MRVLNATQMREADRVTIEEVGIPGLVLMENAGRAVVKELEARFDDLAFTSIAVICGRGNNGGDGFVVSRVLGEHGYSVSVYLAGREAEVRGDAATNLRILKRLDMPIVEVPDDESWEAQLPDVRRAGVIVDALFGTGLREPLRGVYQTIVRDLNAHDAPIVSVDLPSGLSADSTKPIGDAVNATLTVSLGALKLPLVLPPAEGHAGDVIVGEIGIPERVIEQVDGPRVEVISRPDIAPHLLPRDAESNKGDFGRIMIVAGSPGKSGAAHLSGLAALRAGAGLVTIATPRSCQAIVAGMAPEYMTIGLDEDGEGVAAGAIEAVLEARADVIAVGPGLGTGAGAQALVFGLLERSPRSLVLDADALNACAVEPARLRGRDGVDIMITPHPGELARLTGLSIDEIQQNRLDVAREFAAKHGVFLVLKGHRTLVASPEGDVSINQTGNPGMATGGTGDVLTGMIAAWYGQLGDAYAACRVAVFLHGLAGDLARKHQGEAALIARDIVSYLGAATREVLGTADGDDDED
jgi:NAD(P)H-hydrate epimerase